MENEIHVSTTGEVQRTIGAFAQVWRFDYRRVFPTGATTEETLTRIATNPNYGPGRHSFWLNLREDGTWSFLPADDPSGDIIIVIEEAHA